MKKLYKLLRTIYCTQWSVHCLILRLGQFLLHFLVLQGFFTYRGESDRTFKLATLTLAVQHVQKPAWSQLWPVDLSLLKITVQLGLFQPHLTPTGHISWGHLHKKKTRSSCNRMNIEVLRCIFIRWNHFNLMKIKLCMFENALVVYLKS